MISLYNVSKSVPEPQNGMRQVLRGATIALPVNRRIVLFGTDLAGQSAVLHLLAGSETPDQGRIISGRVRFSPVVNSRGTAGGMLVPQLSAVDNVRFFARLHGIDPLLLIRRVARASELGAALGQPVSAFNGPMRRALEAALMAAVPYDCYLVDRLHDFSPPQRWMIARAARRRHAGLLFTTNNRRIAENQAEFGTAIRDGLLTSLSYITTANAAHDGSEQRQ